MSFRKINTGFRQYSDPRFEKMSSVIVSNVAANPTVFANPVPAVSKLQDAATIFSDMLKKAANRGRVEVAEKNMARQNFEELLQQLGMYVMNIANGDEAILTMSGFPLRKVNELRHIAAPKNVTVSNGVTGGELVVSVKSEAGASVFVHEVTTVYQGENTVWQSVSTSTSRYVHSNLQPGQQYWFRVGVGGARGQFAYSPVATRYAQ